MFTASPGNLPEFIEYLILNHQKQEYINILIRLQFNLEDLEILLYEKKSQCPETFPE